MDKEQIIICPKCGGSEAVKKLSIIYAEDMILHSGPSIIGGLRPPARPTLNDITKTISEAVSKYENFIGKYIGGMAGCLVQFVTLLAFPFMGWLYICIQLSSMITTGKPINMAEKGDDLTAILGLILFIVIPSILGYFILRRSWRFHQEHDPPWLIAVEEWSKRFFCQRCNLVFFSEAPFLLSTISVDLSWIKDEKSTTEERMVAEKAVKTLVGIAKNSHCVVCHKGIQGIFLSNINFNGLSNFASQKLRVAGFVCPTCGAFYCKKCKTKPKALGIKIVDGVSTFMCASCCKAPTPTLDVIVDTKGWYESIPQVIE